MISRAARAVPRSLSLSLFPRAARQPPLPPPAARRHHCLKPVPPSLCSLPFPSLPAPFLVLFDARPPLSLSLLPLLPPPPGPLDDLSAAAHLFERQGAGQLPSGGTGARAAVPKTYRLLSLFFTLLFLRARARARVAAVCGRRPERAAPLTAAAAAERRRRRADTTSRARGALLGGPAPTHTPGPPPFSLPSAFQNPLLGLYFPFCRPSSPCVFGLCVCERDCETLPCKKA